MNITYIVPELNKNGGIQKFAESIYTGLKNELDIKMLDWENDLNLIVKGVLRCSPARVGSFLYSHMFSTHFRKRYKLTDNDLIHFWHPEPAMAFLDKKYIVSCHGMEILQENVKSFREVMYPRVLNEAIVIHVNSNYTKNLVLRFDVPEEKVKVINPPIDYGKLASQNKIYKDKIVIGTLARFNRRKNVLNIIKALNIFKERYNPNFVYYLAGDGTDKRRILEELSKAKFEWKYFGEISETRKIKEFYPSLDVFVMPTLELPTDVEGFGIVYLEANAYGIPVVASRTGGVPDAVKEGVSGVFADPTNPEDIAAKIFEVLEDKGKYFWSARNWAKRFDIKIIAKEFAKMYEEAI